METKTTTARTLNGFLVKVRQPVVPVSPIHRELKISTSKGEIYREQIISNLSAQTLAVSMVERARQLQGAMPEVEGLEIRLVETYQKAKPGKIGPATSDAVVAETETEQIEAVYIC